MEYALGAAGPIFSPFGKPNTGERWKIWIRNFEYYIDGQIELIVSDKQKVNRLLHQAGQEVQDIYESIKEEDVEGTKEYEKCKQRLKNYIIPELNTAYERQKFRNISMENESIEMFVLKLRKQAAYRKFLDIDEAIRDQEVMQEFRAPQNVAEVRSFLGLVNFSARFIPQFSTITTPLKELTKKDSLFVWTKEHEDAFQKLNDLITSAPALGFYNKNAETTLVTDASPVGIAAVLIKKQTIERREQPIIIKYISKALSPTETTLFSD
ncbi:unnamed protein product [Euphydryas editha]|uniref:Reverse transcriptase/retrotransposon-derived protein RNase H-like domain-containing protein n=1 Tax=Euphydryas editha TaxID=104508 RepID=A0AAU9TFW5_EUPED|nr:unnamed protein product [Euphydryas editha]